MNFAFIMFLNLPCLAISHSHVNTNVIPGPVIEHAPYLNDVNLSPAPPLPQVCNFF